MLYGRGWSGRQVLKNVCGILAVFSLGYAGVAFRHFVEKIRDYHMEEC